MDGFYQEQDQQKAEEQELPMETIPMFMPYDSTSFLPGYTDQSYNDMSTNFMFGSGMRGNFHSALFNQPFKPAATLGSLFPSHLSLDSASFNTNSFNPNSLNPSNINISTSNLIPGTVNLNDVNPNNINTNDLNPNNLQLPMQPLPAMQSQTNIVKPSSSSTVGMYSSTGFDLISVLSYVANRPNPVVHIGPVDLSCSFLLVDARKRDFPIVYVSPTFETLTGYATPEIIGRNCRFLQAPDGRVIEGSRRKFSDNESVFGFKTNILQTKECQFSIVNYRKNGQPFFNLVTIIPIIEGGSVNFFIGLQVDLVNQPTAIIDNMKNNTWSMNYAKPTFTKTITTGLSDWFNGLPSSVPYENLAGIFNATSDTTRNEANYREWIKLLLENTADLVYVLSLKGTILYMSSTSEKMLGYLPSELIGSNISSICHTGDLVPTLRELKESTNGDSSLNLTFRVNSKLENNYVWLESSGKLHGDMGKGRRCVVLTGRVRPMYNLSNAAVVESNGQPSSSDIWMKLSMDAIILFSSSKCEEHLGYENAELVGTTLYQLFPSDRAYSLTTALDQACAGTTSSFSHHLQNKRGVYIEAKTTFFPGEEVDENTGRASFILCRTVVSSESSPIPEPDYKIDFLKSKPFSSDDMFGFLNDNGSSSTWQYEIHQLRLKNKKLREMIDDLEPGTGKLRKKRNAPKKARTCHSCNRSNTTEWRRGPNGPSTLCNPCGLKFSKGLHPFDSNNPVGQPLSLNDSSDSQGSV